jgi:hypothetical protein
VKKYRNFYIRYEYSESVITATILPSENGETLALVTHGDIKELNKLVRLWVDNKLKENKHYIREYNKAKKSIGLDSLQHWLSS